MRDQRATRSERTVSENPEDFNCQGSTLWGLLTNFARRLFKKTDDKLELFFVVVLMQIGLTGD